MKYIIESYDILRKCHICRDEEGISHAIDLSVSASFPEYDRLTTNEEFEKKDTELIGKTIFIERLSPYIEIAYNITITN